MDNGYPNSKQTLRMNSENSFQLLTIMVSTEFE